jgi:hypothetical protein
VDHKIEKYLAYSVLTDSTGVYKEIVALGESTDENEYLSQLNSNVKRIVEMYKDQYHNVVVHTPFKIKAKHLVSITKSVSTLADDKRTFVVIKINLKSKFFGFNFQTNSMVPYEGTFSKISGNEYLVWFEGLQCHNPNAYRKFSGPTHIEFYYTNKSEFTEAERLAYLQDLINLSGANWRGFNAKTLPVSVFYCQLVAKFLKEFDRLGLPEIELSNRTPWFL